MRSPFRTPIHSPARAVAAGVLAVCHLFAACGVPLPVSPTTRKDVSRPYPCMNRPCGCGTYEECWAGDCCCFTLAEKVAWARANGIEPPVTSAAEPTCAAEPDACELCHPKPKRKAAEACPLCEKPTAVAAGLRWVVGVFAQKCHGEPAGGFAHLPPAVLPEPIAPLWVVGRDPFRTPKSVRADARVEAPASPPPRSS